MYDKRRNSGLCPRCGKPLDREGFYCESCRIIRNQYNTSNKEFYRKYGICPRCGKEKLLGGEKACPECRAKDADYKLKAYQKNSDKIKKRQSDYAKVRYKQRAELGLCTRCGKRKAQEGYRQCEICKEKNRIAKRIKYKNKIPERGKEGTCYRCGNRIENNRYKLCNKCVEQNRANSQFVDRINHYWRQLDKAVYVKG